MLGFEFVEFVEVVALVIIVFVILFTNSAVSVSDRLANIFDNLQNVTPFLFDSIPTSIDNNCGVCNG